MICAQIREKQALVKLVLEKWLNTLPSQSMH